MKLDYFTACFQNASSIFMTFFILRSFLMSFLLTQKNSRTQREEQLLKQEALLMLLYLLLLLPNQYIYVSSFAKIKQINLTGEAECLLFINLL